MRADFNRDGFADLAVGAQGENNARGAVNVIYGSARGLAAAGNQYWTQDSPGINGNAENFDEFGSALAGGDFNGDGLADLAVGVPGEDSFRGAVNVIYGSARGLTAAGNQYWTQNSPGIRGNAEASDSFGSALAAANYGKTAQADLAVGLPGENMAQGAVQVIYGSARGLTAVGNQYLTQDSAAIQGIAENTDSFGWALAAANYGKSAQADLAVGTPNDSGRGAVNVIYGSTLGLTAAGNHYWTQDSTGINGTAADFDLFGWALAGGDFNGGGFADLAVGVPGENSFRGAVNVIYGTARGLAATANQYWTQDSAGINGGAEIGDELGSALAAANYGKSAQADLAIGVPEENRPVDVPADSGQGAVNVVYGSNRGLAPAGNQYWTQDSAGINGGAETNDRFGRALGAGDFNGDALADLAVGTPGEDSARGAVNVIYASATGLAAAGDQYWTRNSPGINGTAQANNLFGWALATGRSG